MVQDMEISQNNKTKIKVQLSIIVRDTQYTMHSGKDITSLLLKHPK